jgi:hypothetical protein
VTTPATTDHRTTLAAEITAAESQLARVDQKAGLLLGLTGAAAVGGPAVVTGLKLATAPAVPAWVAVAAFAVAAATVATAVRPQLATRTGRRHGFPRYAGQPAAALLADLDQAASPESQAARLSDLSAVVVAKYRRIRLAVDLILGGIGCGAVAAIVAAITK